MNKFCEKTVSMSNAIQEPSCWYRSFWTWLKSAKDMWSVALIGQISGKSMVIERTQNTVVYVHSGNRGYVQNSYSCCTLINWETWQIITIIFCGAGSSNAFYWKTFTMIKKLTWVYDIAASACKWYFKWYDNDERLRIVQLKQVTNVTTTNYKLIDWLIIIAYRFRLIKTNGLCFFHNTNQILYTF